MTKAAGIGIGGFGWLVDGDLQLLELGELGPANCAGF